MCEIKFTVKVTFGAGCEKPNLGEMVKFAKALDGDPTQIEAVYKVSQEKAIFIKYRCEEALQHALDFNAEDQVFRYENGKAVNVRMSHAGEHVQYVRVHDLPPEVPDQELIAVLSKYGNVKRVVREKFPSELLLDAYTGVRGAYIDVKKEIPTALHFSSRRGNIFYPGNKDRCFACKKEGHRMDCCPERKSRKQKQNDEKREENTYAAVVSGEASSNNGNQQTESKPEEEVHEEDMAISNDEISEDESESSLKNNVIYRLALKIKEKQDEEKEKKRLQESKEQRDREKAKAKKKYHK